MLFLQMQSDFFLPKPRKLRNRHLRKPLVVQVRSPKDILSVYSLPLLCLAGWEMGTPSHPREVHIYDLPWM